MPNIVVETLSFEPDKPPHIGGLKECSGFVPTVSGMKTAPVPISVAKTLEDDCRGIDTFQAFPSVSNTIVAGTSEKLFLDTGTGFTDYSDSGGYNLASNLSHDWCFAAFNEKIYASSLSELLQETDGGGDFAPVTDSPRAKIIVPFGLFLMAFALDGAYEHRDGWWCSQEADADNWTVGTNQSDRGRLYATAGEITAAEPLGDILVAYKENGAYTANYTGNPYKPFQWSLIPGSQGCISPKAVATIYPRGYPAQLVVGPKNLYIFDGNRQTIIGDGEVQQYFYNRLATTNRAQILVDHRNNLAYICFVSTATVDTSILDDCLVWNYSTNRWGVGRNYDARHVFMYPEILYGTSSFKPGLINSANIVRTLDGNPTSLDTSYVTTRAYGDENKITHVNRLRIRELTSASDAFNVTDVTHCAADGLSFQSQTTDVAPITKNRADFRRSARWHKDKISVKGNGEFDAVSISVTQDSDE